MVREEHLEGYETLLATHKIYRHSLNEANILTKTETYKNNNELAKINQLHPRKATLGVGDSHR
jgi:hypothetical protein